MSVFLRNISVKGIKNICKKVELTFSKKEIKSFSELQDYNVKAIYGANGSGKTALIHAFQILHDIVFKNGYLFDSDDTKNLFELMNKECKSIELELDFFHSFKNEKPNIYSYSIQLEYRNNQFEIGYEKFSKRTSEYTKDKIIVEVVNGTFVHYELDESYKGDFTNLLKKRSFAEILLDSNIEKWEDSILVVAPLLDFVYFTNIYLDEKDNHIPAFTNSTEKLEEMLVYRLNNKTIIDGGKEAGYSPNMLSENQLIEYKNEVESKVKFIQLFKPNIKGIEIVSRHVKTEKQIKYYMVNDHIDYGDYSIDIELESVGVKKLMFLYDAFKHLSRGGIVIIDELDAHINDVYLVKLIEYASKYSKGQLIFTTHNVSPMETLKSKKNSVDFMTLSGEIVSWTQVGNYSPSKLYQKGMVQGLPFNIDAESFLAVFDDEQ